uniref:Calponin-homology (CH) domain-containing protein n=1 Tax=Mola mola TaxID=94237 RepID=A0A3Q3WKP0_MOLML
GRGGMGTPLLSSVANEKIDDINGCPKSRSQMIENIDACLSFLAAKGVNIQGLSAEEIRNGNLKAILGLFFSLSRYKQQQQQQQQAQRQHSQPSLPPASQSQTTHPPLSQQSSAPAHDAMAPPSGQLPGPSARVSTAGSDIPPRGSVSAAGNRRSQGFNSSEGMTSQPTVTTEHAPPSAVTVSSSTSIPTATSGLIPPPSSSSSSSKAIPQPSSNGKPWRSKSTSSKHAASAAPATSNPPSAMQSIKQEKDTSCKAALASEAPKVVTQKSMLEKLKLFNSKGASKSSASSNGIAAQTYGAAPTAGTTVSTTASSPKIALKGIAQRTFSRALTAKKGSVKGAEKDKEKGKEKEKEKEKGKEVGKRISVPERTELRGEELKEEVAQVALDPESSNKRTSKITSFIPKGGKMAKKESSTPAHSGIPKPGSKAPGVGGKAPSVKEAGERPRSMRLGGGLATHRGPLDRDRDSRHSSSTSSLASTEGKSSTAPVAGGGNTQSTASNTVSVQLPQNQQHHSHPNTATVAPFMYR